MPIFRWDQSWNPLRDLEREVDRLIQGVEFSVQGIRMPRQYPAVNIFELEHEFLITAELPGMQVEDLELTIANSVLTLKGHRNSPVSENEAIPEERFRRRERTFGEWQRSISIPDRISDEHLSAEFNDGVLKIHLPKLEEESPRQIPVSSGEQEAQMSQPHEHEEPRSLSHPEQFVFTPPIDIYETDEGLVLYADLPGVSVGSLELQVQDNKLTLLGKVEPQIPEGARPIHKEYEVGNYLRSFILSGEIVHSEIEAKLTNGVLRIFLPKAPKAEPRRIQVNTG